MAFIGAIPEHLQAMYTQYDFIPQEIMDMWTESGYIVSEVFRWLRIPLELMRALLTSLGAEPDAHVSSIAHISIPEYEMIIAPNDIMGHSVSPVMRSKFRQVLLSCRIITGVARAPDPPVASAIHLAPT